MNAYVVSYLLDLAIVYKQVDNINLKGDDMSVSLSQFVSAVLK